MSVLRHGDNWFRRASRVAAQITIAAGLLGPAAWAGVKRDVRAVCAAFASTGGSVAVTTDATDLSAEIRGPGGDSFQLSFSLDEAEKAYTRYACRAYFDSDGGLLAIGLADGLPGGGSLRVGVVDTEKRQWVGDWTIGPASGIYAPRLLGFFEKTTSVVVGGSVSQPVGPPFEIHSSFSSQLFSPQGQPQRLTAERRQYNSAAGLQYSYADAVHNRLWIFDCYIVAAPRSRQPDCPVSWMTFIGPFSASPWFAPGQPGEKRVDFWLTPNTFAAPGRNAILAAEGQMVWRIDLQSRTVESKRFRFLNSEQIEGEAAISPDGQIVALPLVRWALAFPYFLDNYRYKGTDFAVVQLRPLQLLGIVPGADSKSRSACAVDDRDGRVVALVFHQDGWVRTVLKRPPQP